MNKIKVRLVLGVLLIGLSFGNIIFNKSGYGMDILTALGLLGLGIATVISAIIQHRKSKH
jgi:hypothetical protein